MPGKLVSAVKSFFKSLFSAKRWLTIFALITLGLLVAVALLAPQQLPVVLYKATLATLAMCVGVWIDRAVFPYSRPSGYLKDDWLDDPDAAGADDEPDFSIAAGYTLPFVGAMLRRAMLMAAAVISICLGL